MTSLQRQPKYGHTAPGPGSGLDENPNTRSANQLQGGKKAEAAAGQQARTMKASMTNAAKTRSGVGGEEQSGIEHFET
ncbi:hypothetical protein F4815DRAFT_441436 [Daldinia loculata]|nr:hypothetical protein F4815DRAFT_441436 [Daldinia loculata]